MISEAFLHLPGIGPARLARLRAAGLRTWHDLVAAPHELPAGAREAILAECHRCQLAYQDRDVAYLVRTLAPPDRWRILAHFFDDATFCDIETEGLEADARVTVIAAWHRGQLRYFVDGENFDDFLQLLDEARILVSFNGQSFDVPRILNAFHIPALPCPHLDLRWMCHHHGWKGGLKVIANRLGIQRPVDLVDATGWMAVWWWQRWRQQGDETARNQLLRYCGADTLLLPLVAAHLAGRYDVPLGPASPGIWDHLPPSVTEPPRVADRALGRPRTDAGAGHWGRGRLPAAP